MNSSGRVGVGTTPDGAYVLKTTSLRTTGNNYFAGNLGIGTGPFVPYKLAVGGNSYFSGYVGIGIDPSYSLHVSGKTYFTYSNTSPGFTFITNTGAAPGVYISGDANYDLNVNGNAYTTGSWVGSDSRLKKNIKDLDHTEILSKLGKVSGKKYEFKSKAELFEIYRKTSENPEINMVAPQLDAGQQYGLIAQEIEMEFPELVKTDSLTGIKAINYNGMIPILLEAIKAQNEMIGKLQADVNKLSKKSNPNAKQLEVDNNETIETNNWILQNAPNPSNGATQIEYQISESSISAFIYVYDMQGTQLKSYAVYGSGSLTIQSGELKAGMYIYGLVVKGQLIDSKKMVLTK